MNRTKESGGTTDTSGKARDATYQRRAAGKFSGTARRAVRCDMAQGLIQIVADVCPPVALLPSAYPAPGSRVTTTLYA